VDGGIAIVGDRVGKLSVHSGLRLDTRAHDAAAQGGAGTAGSTTAGSLKAKDAYGSCDLGSHSKLSGSEERSRRIERRDARLAPGRQTAPLIAHITWTSGERFAVTGNNEHHCLCVWQNESALGHALG
jgi:hypothetical protein